MRRATKQIDPLSVRPVASSSRCAYFPDTCFLEISDSRELELLTKEALVSGAPDEGSASLECLGLIAHENVHWIQAAAFGSGQFLASLDQTCTQLAESFLGMLDADTRSQLFEQRRLGKPLTRLLTDFSISNEIPVGALAERIRRHWVGIRLLRRAIDIGDWPVQWEDDFTFYFGLARLYFDAGADVSTVAMLPGDDLYEAAIARAPLNMTFSEDDRHLLSTASLCECAAVLDEHWLYAYHSEWCRQNGKAQESDRWWEILNRSWRNRESTFYADAFRVFAADNPDLDLNDSTVLATLEAICCLALDGNFASGREWNEIYPPTRFQRLSSALKQTGALPTYSVTRMAPDIFKEWSNKICTAAGLPALKRQQLNTRELKWGQSPVDDLTLTFQESYQAATELMVLCPAGLICPSEAEVYLEELLLTPELTALDFARRAPLLILNREMSWLYFDEAKASRVAEAGLYQRILLELMSKSGPLSTMGRPARSLGNAVARSAFRKAEDRLKLDLPDFVA